LDHCAVAYVVPEKDENDRQQVVNTRI